ncbi:MAG: hypothetical protein PF448_04395 [Bacteroidales bacterium]|jgi:hypothetical protein|nr:hypothetical protein [Bacteroidales bacterium]
MKTIRAILLVLCAIMIIAVADAQQVDKKSDNNGTKTEKVLIQKKININKQTEVTKRHKLEVLEISDNETRENTISENEQIETNKFPDTVENIEASDAINNKPVFLKGYEFGYDDSGQNKTPQTRAAPANDDICSAINLPINGSCIDNETNAQSTSDYFGGCIPNGSPSVFYEFTPTGSNNMLTITMNDFAELGRQISFMLFEGPCTAPTVISAYCTNTPYTASGTLEQSFYNLTAGTAYYLMIATQPGVGNELSAYDICAQESTTPPLITGPQQDCYGAVPVCDITYSQTYSYTGVGSSDEINTGATCIYGGESNSVWYVFTPQTSGSFFFEIETLMDYDWALYNLTDIGGCDYISSSDPVLCNYSGTNGNTGTNTTVNNTLPREEDALGSPIMDGMDVTAGNAYALLVNNYSADANGYTITFDGTASIADNPIGTPSTGSYPSMSSVAASCTSNSIEVAMSELIECLSISQGGFTLTNTTTSTDFSSAMTAFYGENCSSSELTTTLIIDHDGTLTTGTYELEVVNPNTIADKCGNLLQVGETVTFNYLANLSLTANPSSICSGESITLDADGADGTPSVATYTLNPGGSTNTTNGQFTGLSPAITTTYTVLATYGGCTRTATETVNVEGNIIVSVDPTGKTVCDFTTPIALTASTSINGTDCPSCLYSWSTTETTESINVNAAGTYTVSSVTPNGCASFNTAESVITLAGGGSGGNSCDVLYVSPSGGGAGFTKDSPAKLADAVEEARCTNTSIKMMVGVYDLSDFQIVPSYITIEGGYSSDFLTKSSDMSGGSNSTTIRRSTGADDGFSDECSAFRVEDGAEEFRIQNLRIEMPGSTNVAGHAASSGLKNYGIKLGATCENYHIIRCYIDAGVGAAP